MPAVVSDGHMFVYATASNGNLYYRNRTESSNTWSGWKDHGQPSGATLTGDS